MLQNKSLLYRDATHKDVRALKELALASYGRLKNEMTAQNWVKMQAVLTSDENFPVMVQTCFGFVCEDAERLLGMAFLVPHGNPTKIYSHGTSYLRMVGVHPDADGKGIAQHLTRQCIGKAKETGEKMISLHSAEVMYAARHIYEKLGFKKIRLLDEHYGFKYWLYQLNLE
jgi:ribosomal protein S18 acetylase RimI-like enzyme